MEISDRIRTRMKELGLKSVDVTKAMKVSSGGVSQWLNGLTKPSGQNLLNLAKLLKTSPTWLLSGELEKQREANVSNDGLSQADIYEHHSPLHHDDVEVPFFEEVELAAGNGFTSMLDSSSKTSRLSISMLETAKVPASSVACCKVVGNSMERVLKNGAKIAIDTRKSAIKDGSIYAIEHGGMLRVKYLYRLPFNGLRIRSENEDDYPDEELSQEDAKEVRIIGRVFWQESIL
ncbi:S24 family peptidase [Marinomonas primoryensis]|uniref:S24 family peptidase n=1 Tax=Marinomonas primoryensis TaxID=178399 RepID=UPI00370465F8